MTPQNSVYSRNTKTETSELRSISSIGQTPCRNPEVQNHVKEAGNVRSQFCDDLSASLSKVCQLETQSEDSDGKLVIVSSMVLTAEVSKSVTHEIPYGERPSQSISLSSGCLMKKKQYNCNPPLPIRKVSYFLYSN